MNPTDHDGRVTFAGSDGELHVTDVIENETLVVGVDGTPELEPGLTDVFPFPVDRAVSFEAGELVFENVAELRLRDEHGETVADLIEPESFPRDTYCLEVTGSLKLYVRMRDVAIDAEGIRGPAPARLTFDESAVVTLGGRSQHTRPEATVTVPDDPGSLMDAVSVLGSSIKEFSAERSWPSLRGYPPRFERGDELRIPDQLFTPDTDVRITVPETHADVYRVAPLAFYLGARVEPGDPAIHLDGGYVETLPTTGSDLERRVETLLGHVLVLDSLVRMEGYIPSDRLEYDEIGSKLPFYPPNLYDRSVAEQLLEYLEVDPSTTARYVPTPPVRAQLRPDPADLELLPHLAHGLSPIRVACQASPAGAARESTADVAASDGDGVGPFAVPEGIHAVTGRGSGTVDRLAATPTGTALLTPATYENRLVRGPSPEGETVVRLLVDDGTRAADLQRLFAPIDGESEPTVDVVAAPTVAEAEATLSDPGVDVCYAALPTDDRTLVCRDGHFDPAGLELVGPSVVVVEGSADADVGIPVVDGGAYLAMLIRQRPSDDVLRQLLRLLRAGLNVAEAVRLSGIERETGVWYVGDPTHRAATLKRGTMKGLLRFDPVDNGEFSPSLWQSLSMDIRCGTEFKYLQDEDGLPAALAGGSRLESSKTVGPAAVVESVDEPDVVTFLGDVPLFSSVSPQEVVELGERIRSAERRRLVGLD